MKTVNADESMDDADLDAVTAILADLVKQAQTIVNATKILEEKENRPPQERLSKQ